MLNTQLLLYATYEVPELRESCQGINNQLCAIKTQEMKLIMLESRFKKQGSIN